MAPKGCDCFYVLSPVPNLKGNLDWKKNGDKYKNKILLALRKNNNARIKKKSRSLFLYDT